MDGWVPAELSAMMRTMWGCVALCLGSLCCDTTEISSSSTLSLRPLDVTCTDAVLELGAGADIPRPASLVLLRNDVALRTISLSGRDTLLLEEDLNPGTSYIYQAALRGDMRASAPAPVRTLDTTTHDWTFEKILIGRPPTSGELWDVCIVDENLVYAVGEIQSADSLGNWDYVPYNMVRWDGVSWNLFRVRFFSVCGRPAVGIDPAHSVLSFPANDLWIASSGTGVARWNGLGQTDTLCLSTQPPILFMSMWGTNPGPIYLSGYRGIARLDGRVLSAMQLPTLPIPPSDLLFLDLTGSNDGATVFCPAGIITIQDQANYLLRLRPPGNWELAYNGTHSMYQSRPDSISGEVFSVYMSGPQFLFLATSRGHFLAPSWTRGQARRLDDGASSVPRKLRGSGASNIFSVGSGAIRHFNGATWRVYPETDLTSGWYNSAAVRDNLAIIVGWEANRGVVVIARKS